MVIRRITTLALGLLLGLAGVVITVGPAQAAVPNVYGFAFLQTPTPAPGLVLDPTRQWGSWKTAFPADFATVTQIGLGRYRVRFPHINSGMRGVAHVTAVAGDARWCQVMTWFGAGLDEFVDVQCYRNGGIMDNSRFAVMYSNSSGPPVGPGSYAYVFGNLTGGVVNTYNTSGLANTSVKIANGRYRVTIPGLAGPLAPEGNLQVTAVHPNSPRRCKISFWGRIGADYVTEVLCHDQLNVPTDTWFNLTYHNQRSVFGAVNPPVNLAYLWTAGGGLTNFNSQGGANTVAASGVGRFLVTFERVGLRETHVQVTAFGVTPDYCNLQEFWILNGTTVVVRNVICWDGAGLATGNRFYVTYSSRF